jgi:large subunit ribosomal protein L3
MHEEIMANESMGLLGFKVGMTQIYNENNDIVPVTVVSVAGNTVLRVKSSEGKDGYNAVQLGIGERKAKHTTKPQQVAFEKINVTPKKFIREVRVAAEEAGKYTGGQELNVADFFNGGDKIDVTGTSKGRGFAGVMKRHNFKGFIRSHGTHEYFRHGGSIGTRLTPGHVIKGKKMPGHMGNKRVTMQNLHIERVDAERGLLFIRGGVPGANKGLLLIRTAVKTEG